MDSTSSFSVHKQDFANAELLPVRGSTCECYRVRLYGKLHFLKRLKPELRTNPRHIAALNKEFETGYRLEHPHLVRYAAKTADGLLMEYVDGETLSQFMEHHQDYFRHRKNVNRIIAQLLSVVGYLHQQQVIHLDLKPENILITRVGHDVKLIDLGYCYTDSYNDTMGRTDKYAAPEQKDPAMRVDQRADIYAIGRILQTFPCARIYNKVIKKCTERFPANRYQSTEQLSEALKPNRRYLIVVVGIALCMAVLLAVLLFKTPASPSHDTPYITQTGSGQSTQPQNDNRTTSGNDKTTPISIPTTTTPTISQVPSASVSSPYTSPIEVPRAIENPKAIAATAETEQITPVASGDKAQVPMPKMPSAADMSRLHQEIDRLVKPLFNKHLATYQHRDYYEMTQPEIEEYGKHHAQFSIEVGNLMAVELFQKYEGQYSDEVMSDELRKVLRHYDEQLFRK